MVVAISSSEISVVKVPNHIAKHMEELNLPYEIEQQDNDLLTSRIQRANVNSKLLARCLYLKAGDQTIRYVGSVTALFSIDAVSEHLKKKCSPLSIEEEQSLNARQGCESVNAVPTTNSPATLIDEGLLKAQKVYLPCGIKNLFIVVSGAVVSKLYADCPTLKADIALPSLDDYDQGLTHNDISDIHNAIRGYTSLRIKKELQDTLSIPPLPMIAQQILELRSNPSADIEDLAKIVGLDPALAAQVVGWASSPYYSAPGKINSIHDAIVRVLGFQLVMNLVLGLSIGKTLKYPEECPYGIKSFWQQSIYCAITMEKLNRAINSEQRASPGLCYLIGLLNNFGYLVVAHIFPNYFQQINQLQLANRHLLYCHIEFYLLGVCRDQISSHLLQAWKLPAEVSTALRFQHLADYSGHHHTYANLCFITKRLLKAKGIGQIPYSTIPVHLYERLGLEPNAIEQVMNDVFDSSQEIDQMTSLFVKN